MRNDCKIHKIYIKDNKIICKAIWGMNKLPVTENNERKKKKNQRNCKKDDIVHDPNIMHFIIQLKILAK